MKDSAYYYREIEPQKMDGVKLYRVKETPMETGGGAWGTCSGTKHLAIRLR